METIVSDRPVSVGEREFVPLVRIHLTGRRRLSLGDTGLSGTAWARVRLRPVALIERGPAGERRLLIPDETTRLLSGLLLAAFLIPLLLEVAVRLYRNR